ncbi:MAG: hypothetical protein ACI80V_001500 [Rhodothermales bacterium]|jgi:hypothetical protein
MRPLDRTPSWTWLRPQPRAFFAVVAVYLFLGTTVSAQTFNAADLRDVFRSVETSTAYRFFYRDALIAGQTVSLSLGNDPIGAVSDALTELGLGVRVDDERGQVLVFRLDPQTRPNETHKVSGFVLDGESGGRLPFASITWIDDDGNLRGVSSNEGGFFEVELGSGVSEQLTVSYLGFDPTTVQVNVSGGLREISVRLIAKPLMGREVVVSGTILHSDLDTTWQHLLSPGVLAPLGESSVLRSLASLPSVSLSAALSDGMVVRGSKSDGFQILLDGLPIYSQTHMFGLFDAFNEDALQAVAFYYGIAPASYQAPPGGTVSFLTRTGSQEQVSGSIGASNTSVRGTMEGPLGGGRGSWLVSGRLSYLSNLDWFGNDDLIAQGLDIGRETSIDNLGRRPFEVLSGDASYYDLHAKLLLETKRGGRLTATGYSGGDRTEQLGERRLRTQNATAGQQTSSKSNWGASAVGLQFGQSLAGSAYLSAVGGVTGYSGSYANDSVLGVRREGQAGGSQGPPQLRLDAFANDNRLTQLRFAPEVSVSHGGIWSAGADLNFYDVSYNEFNTNRPDFNLGLEASQVDFYGGYSSPRRGLIRYELGLRSHFYSTGKYTRISPRGQISVGGEGLLSAMLGYSRNHQFLHRLEVQPVEESAPEIWILSSAQESPGMVDYLTGGIYLRPGSSLFLQFEGYRKVYSNLRLHETANPNPGNQSLVGELTNPWLTNVDGWAHGLEVMARHRTGPVLWSHAYTLSKAVYDSPRLLSGAEFPVSWDRRHQYTATLEARRGSIAANATWSIASGTPNPLRFGDPTEANRLPVFHRLDLGVSWERQVGARSVTAGISVYNAYDQKNVWYRTLVPREVSGTIQNPTVESTVAVDVYDLGLHPSFELGIRF